VYEGKLSISKYFLSKLLIAAAPFRDSRKIKRKKEKGKTKNRRAKQDLQKAAHKN